MTWAQSALGAKAKSCADTPDEQNKSPVRISDLVGYIESFIGIDPLWMGYVPPLGADLISEYHK